MIADMRRACALTTAAATTTIACAIAFVALPQVSHAAAYKTNIGVGPSITVGSATFKCKSYQNSQGWYVCKIIMKKNGKSRTLATSAGSVFITNGKYLYYTKIRGKTARPKPDSQGNKTTIYRLKVSSGKQKKIVSGTDWEARTCSGDYLYCGKGYGPEGLDLYALKLSNGKKRHMVSGVGTVQYKSGHVVTNMNAGDVGNYPLYVFKKNGSGKKKVANGSDIVIKGKKIRYVRCKFGNGMRYKKYECGLNGKNKKAISGWMTTYPRNL